MTLHIRPSDVPGVLEGLVGLFPLLLLCGGQVRQHIAHLEAPCIAARDAAAEMVDDQLVPLEDTHQKAEGLQHWEEGLLEHRAKHRQGLHGVPLHAYPRMQRIQCHRGAVGPDLRHLSLPLRSREVAHVGGLLELRHKLSVLRGAAPLLVEVLQARVEVLHHLVEVLRLKRLLPAVPQLQGQLIPTHGTCRGSSSSAACFGVVSAIRANGLQELVHPCCQILNIAAQDLHHLLPVVGEVVADVLALGILRHCTHGVWIHEMVKDARHRAVCVRSQGAEHGAVEKQPHQARTTARHLSERDVLLVLICGRQHVAVRRPVCLIILCRVLGLVMILSADGSAAPRAISHLHGPSALADKEGVAAAALVPVALELPDVLATLQ
mmetsp:Transcript_28467/g.60369  ORF Transcript_28467/g.60369 Transcript_28467/m.60369 type:complete len:379 (+) Transcript_28467:1151-2287(+)